MSTLLKVRSNKRNSSTVIVLARLSAKPDSTIVDSISSFTLKSFGIGWNNRFSKWFFYLEKWWEKLTILIFLAKDKDLKNNLIKFKKWPYFSNYRLSCSSLRWGSPRSSVWRSRSASCFSSRNIDEGDLPIPGKSISFRN